MNPQQRTRRFGRLPGQPTTDYIPDATAHNTFRYRSWSAGPFTVRLTEDGIDIRRWYTTDGEPGDVGDGLACSREVAEKLYDSLRRLLGKPA